MFQNLTFTLIKVSYLKVINFLRNFAFIFANHYFQEIPEALIFVNTLKKF